MNGEGIRDVLGQRLNEVEDICITTGLFDFLLPHLRVGLGSTKQHVEPDRAGVQRLSYGQFTAYALNKETTYRFLRYQRHVFAQFRHIQRGDGIVIKLRKYR